MKSNVSVDIPPHERISDEDILNNINTFMFAGSDTSSLAVTWILYHLAKYPAVQDRLREELFSALPDTLEDMSTLTEDEVHSLYATVENLPFLENVIKESLRLVPPVHSSIRVAVQDDEIPTSYPVVLRDGSIDTKSTVSIRKGDFIHVAVEGFSLDTEFWGKDAWEFKCVCLNHFAMETYTFLHSPDRWDNLPEKAAKLPGLYGNTLSFSFGPRVRRRFCIIISRTKLDSHIDRGVSVRGFPSLRSRASSILLLRHSSLNLRIEGSCLVMCKLSAMFAFVVFLIIPFL